MSQFMTILLMVAAAGGVFLIGFRSESAARLDLIRQERRDQDLRQMAREGLPLR